MPSPSIAGKMPANSVSKSAAVADEDLEERASIGVQETRRRCTVSHTRGEITFLRHALAYFSAAAVRECRGAEGGGVGGGVSLAPPRARTGGRTGLTVAAAATAKQAG